MEKNHTLTTRKIVFAALMAALTVAGSALRVTLPLDIAGTTSFHLGNIMCALSGILLGPWLGGLASGLGSAIYDIMNPLYISECWITFLTKGAYGLVAGLIIRAGGKKFGYVKALLATLAGALTYAVLYLAKSYFYSGLLIKGLTPDAALLTVVAKLPATAFNAVVALVFAHPRGRYSEGAGGKPSDDGITSKYAGCRTLCIPFFMAAPWDILPNPNPDRDIPCPSRFLSAECCSCDRTAAGQCRRH